MIPDHLYACFRQDEVWRGGELQQRRIEQGHCLTTFRSGAISIEASDDFGRTFSERFTHPGRIARELRERSETCLPEAPWMRTVTAVRLVESEQYRGKSVSTTITVRAGQRLSITTDPAHAVDHLALLESCATSAPPVQLDDRQYPILWRNGSGAVLLHEAIGHPAEHSRFMDWPEWLEVRDDPAADALGRMTLDDAGQPVTTRTLTAGEGPAAFRRESFREVPLRRMTSLVVRSSREAEVPAERIEVLLLGGGSYDLATDRISLEVSAARLVSRKGSRNVSPFRFVETRERLRRLLLGSRGDAAIYPGVICGDEGQRLPVGAIAPDLLTDSRS